MAEYRLQPTDYPSTLEYHQDRERAPHLEQPWHQPRLHEAVRLIRSVNPRSVVDLGCGDGGLLSLIKDIPSWGYDFTPANAAAWAERGVVGIQKDVFNGYPPYVFATFASMAVLTEVLEHLRDPHAVVAWVAENVDHIVASVPFDERPGGIVDEHLWGWDEEGFKDLIGDHFRILEYSRVSYTQLILGESKYR